MEGGTFQMLSEQALKVHVLNFLGTWDIGNNNYSTDLG